MTFKSGKENAYNILQARLKEVENQLAQERRKPMLKEFATRLGDAMLAILALTPYEDWPQFAKDTFVWVERETPTTAWEYKQLLPKKEKNNIVIG